MEKCIKKLRLNEKITFLIELYEKERQKLTTVIKPYLQKQEYSLAKEYQDKLNSINEFIGQLKIITFEEENRYILTTFDGVNKFIDDKVFSVQNAPFLIDTIMCLTVSDNITELYPRRIFFSTLEKAEEYIVLNKSCLSIREIAIIIGQCNNTTYIDLDILTKKLKNIVESKIN
jgi:hypothetical protein